MGLDEYIGGLHHLAIFTSALLPVTFFITYAIAVSLGHVPVVLPYISDTGIFPPESCIFAQFLNIAAVLMCVMIYIRYYQAKELSSSYKLFASISRWNVAGVILGLCTSLGLSLVANFQVTTVPTVHAIGAALCFCGGTAYFWVQVWISYKLHPLGLSLKIAHVRLCMALANTVIFIFGCLTLSMASYSYKDESWTHWTPEDEGWEWHLASVILEWVCSGFFCLYILTFAHDFQNLRLKRPKVVHPLPHERNHREDLPTSA